MSSESYRSKADACGQRARESKSLKDIRHFRRLKQSYLALAENEAWLAGDVPPHDEALAPGTEGGGSHA